MRKLFFIFICMMICVSSAFGTYVAVKDYDGSKKYQETTGLGTTDWPYSSVVRVNSTDITSLKATTASLAAGDNNVGNVDIVTLPAANLGQRGSAASVSVVTASDVPDTTYIGDIKFGEALIAGDNNVGNMDIASIASGDNNIGNVDIASSLPAGTNGIGKLTANSGVDIGDVDATSVVPGTGATNGGKAIGNAAGATDTVVPGAFVRDDALSTLSDAEGDYVFGRVESHGALWVWMANAFSYATDSVLAYSPFSEDDAAVSGDNGTAVMFVKKIALGSDSGSVGDYTFGTTDANDRVRVNTTVSQTRWVVDTSSADTAKNVTIPAGGTGVRTHILKYRVVNTGDEVGASGAEIKIAPPTGNTNLPVDAMAAGAAIRSSVESNGNPDLYVSEPNTATVLMMGAAGSGCILTGTVYYRYE
jgi:hypothetical protein